MDDGQICRQKYQYFSDFYSSCSHPADLLLFLQPTQQSHLTPRHANFTSPLPTYSTRSCTMRQQEVTLMRRNIDTSFTGLPECIKVIALSLHCNSLRGRTAPPTPCSSSLLWRGVPAVRHEQLAPFHSHDTYGYGLAWNNEMEPHLSQVGMNVSEDIKRISWLCMFM